MVSVMVSAFVPPIFETLQGRFVLLAFARVVWTGKPARMTMVEVMVVVANVVLFSHPIRASRPWREHGEVHPPVICRTSVRPESSEASSRSQGYDVINDGE